MQGMLNDTRLQVKYKHQAGKTLSWFLVAISRSLQQKRPFQFLFLSDYDEKSIDEKSIDEKSIDNNFRPSEPVHYNSFSLLSTRILTLTSKIIQHHSPHSHNTVVTGYSDWPP